MKNIDILKENYKKLTEEQRNFLAGTPGLGFYIENETYFINWDNKGLEEIGTYEELIDFINANC